MRLLLALSVACLTTQGADSLRFKSAYLEAELSASKTSFAALSVDSLGKGKFQPNAVVADTGRTDETVRSAWTAAFSERTITLENRDATSAGFTMLFNPRSAHATLLGLVRDGRVKLPALLHLPDAGSLRLEADRPVSVIYDASRANVRFVRVTLPAGARYTLTVVAVHPEAPGMEKDPRYDGFRRNYLNGLQVNPRLGMLANNSSSDACAFTLYEAAYIARHAPELAPGLRALDLVRMTLERYLAGFRGYGMPGFRMFEGKSAEADAAVRYPFLDTYPSLLISAYEYVDGTGDTKWLASNYAGLREWAETLLAMDKDGNGLVEYAASGNSGSWGQKTITVRPANWWDTIGFGHEDAYSNALAYGALKNMASLAERAGKRADAKRYTAAADKLRAAYAPALINPKTGVVAGWRSADGALHDYYFPWVSGAAVYYGLLTRGQANAVFDHLFKKMAEVGYTRFDLGLPSNLIPVRKADYVELKHRWGGPELEDGSDAFQIYENGGATSCFAYFTVAALYRLGRTSDANRIFLPMLESLGNGGFSGVAANGMTNDWKTWTGEAWGYEGFLVDNYLTLLAVLEQRGK